MIHSCFLIERFAQQLNELLRNAFLVQIFSTGKDEIIFQFERNRKPLCQLKCVFLDQQLYFLIETEWTSPSKASIPQFKPAHHSRLENIQPVHLDRSFVLNTATGKHIVFKCYGKSSNILLFSDTEDQINSFFRLSLRSDNKSKLSDFQPQTEPQPDPAIFASPAEFRKQYPWLGKKELEYLMARNFFQCDYSRQLVLFSELTDRLKSGPFTLTDEPDLTVLPAEGRTFSADAAVEAFSEYSALLIPRWHFRKRKEQIVQQLTQQLKRKHAYLEMCTEELHALESRISYRDQADVVMANLGSIPENAEQFTGHHLQTGEPVEIRLKPRLTTLQNAEYLYRKAQREKTELEHSRQKLEHAHRQVLELNRKLDLAQQVDDVRQLRQLEKENQKIQTPVAEESGPCRMIEFMGYRIWIGKNAKGNELILNKYSSPNDLWLHARDVSGSHVLIKQKNKNETIPAPVIEKAASIALAQSKARTQPLAPVICTQRKYVRKRKGGAPGEVIVEKEKVLMAVPAESADNSVS